MHIPESMRKELSAWNNGAGIDLETWVYYEGSYSLATAYTTLFWPEFVEFEGYILRKGFSEESLRGFESEAGTTRKAIEWVMNHLHIADTHSEGELTEDIACILANTLKEIYEAKLAYKFPHAPCIVEVYKPEDECALLDYQVSFWQVRHEGPGS